MLLSSLVDYAMGRALGRTDAPGYRRAWLSISLLNNLGLLAFFKYFNFFRENFVQLADQIGWQVNAGTLEIILPVGISFYTFQTLSYTIDVYRRRLEPTESLTHYLAFVSLFSSIGCRPDRACDTSVAAVCSAANFRRTEQS